ncbi:MAG: hypothetical protein NTV79_03450 [Candidatus Aureabacteria bacterium]|nr:hypothetical protein [Candidatus Auribacterota bacterium]
MLIILYDLRLPAEALIKVEGAKAGVLSLPAILSAEGGSPELVEGRRRVVNLGYGRPKLTDD